MKFNIRQHLLTTTLLVTAGFAMPAYAQQAQPDPADADPAATTAPVEGTVTPSVSAEGEPVDEASEIVVTGSRIPQPNLTSSSPVTVVTSAEIKLQGTTRTEDLLNSLPQTFAGQGSNISNGSTGTATVDLRGLGAARTLVLINGRRLMPGDPRSPVADLNFVPASLIKRVDVLTGGASSTYGADAVSGVVNFIMDSSFTGLRIDGQASVFNHDNDLSGDVIEAIDARGFPRPRGLSTNGGAQDISIAMGAGFDDNRGHVMGYATYRKQRAVLQSSRDYSACSLTATSPSQQATPDRNGREFDCGGSGTSANGTFQQFNPNTFAQRPNFQVGPNGTFIPGSTPFNFAPYNYYQRPNERYTFGVFAEYEISEAAKPYLEAMFMDDQSIAQIAPSGDFGNTNSLNCDNPLLSAQQVTFLCNNPAFPTFTNANGGQSALVYTLRRNVEGGGRQDDLQHTAFRVVAGIRGKVAPGVSYDAYYQFGKTILAQTYLNDFSVSRLGRALDVVADPDSGAPVCSSVLDGTDPNCVPYDIFSPAGVSQEALTYLQTPGFSRGDVQQTIAQADLTLDGGEYGVQTPWADRGIGVNVGAAYLKNKLTFNTDAAFTTGDLAGQGGPTIGVSGDFDVREFFGEIQVPLVTNSFFEELTLSAGYRYSDYKVSDNSFSTDTYKLALEFAPIEDLRFRASYNRAVRAPNVVELFSAQSLQLSGSEDPCAGAAVGGLVNGLTAAQCALTGVSGTQFGNIAPNPADQYNGFLGGNPDLAPETADSYTVGVVIQPRFIPGLAVTIDAFDIRVKEAIGVIGFDTIVDQCLQTADPFFCNRINRAPGTGSLWLGTQGFVVDLNTNVGGVRTRGIDVSASYARELGSFAKLNVSFIGTYLDELEINPLADIKYNCAGYFGNQCGTPNPKWRHKLRAGFAFPSGIGLSGQWRHFDGVEVDALSNDEDLAGIERSAGVNGSPALYDGNRELKAQDYFDLTLTARVKEKYSLRLGVNNIFDRAPPLAGGQVVFAGSGNGNTFPQVYDALGRYLFAGFTVDF